MNKNKKSLILIVDDSPQNLQVLGNIIKAKGYRLALAENGVEALDFVKKKQPDLILLDIMMPNMDGFEVCRRLKKALITKDIPIIFLTARSEKKVIIEGLELGAVDYVTKPFSTKELITRINTHLELKAAKEALKQSLAAKDKFFSIIAHDLGNLFNVTLSTSNMLVNYKRRPKPDEQEDFLASIHGNLKKGYDLLKNLLEWSRSQTGKLKVTPITLNLQTIVDQNILLLKNSAKTKNVTLFSSVVYPTSCFADEQMINTVIRNLLSNAIKFTPANGKIEIFSKEENNFVELSISDTGVGIKPEDVDRLFQIDVSHTTVGTNEEKGTGLGLILCKEFVEKNGGTIGVESDEGKGSRFYIGFPSSSTA